MTELGMALSNPYEVTGRVPGSVGKTLPGVTAALRKDDESIDELSIEGEGELLIKGDTLFDRYLNKPEATEKEFVKGWFKTGDYVQKKSDGTFRILGRIS